MVEGKEYGNKEGVTITIIMTGFGLSTNGKRYIRHSDANSQWTMDMLYRENDSMMNLGSQ